MGSVGLMYYRSTSKCALETPNLDLPVGFAKRERHFVSLSIPQAERNLAVKRISYYFCHGGRIII
jgi:hypothetical protein